MRANEHRIALSYNAMRTREAIVQELATEEVKLTELERGLSATRARIDTLRAELQTASAAKQTAPPVAVPIPHTAPTTAADKVKLFRSLFRGRTDVFPVRFISKKTGSRGYAPACSNKWEPGLCHLKSGGKCSNCPNQAFVPVEDRIVIDHLRGHHVIGCYPMLEAHGLLSHHGDHGSPPRIEHAVLRSPLS